MNSFKSRSNLTTMKIMTTSKKSVIWKTSGHAQYHNTVHILCQWKAQCPFNPFNGFLIIWGWQINNKTPPSKTTVLQKDLILQDNAINIPGTVKLHVLWLKNGSNATWKLTLKFWPIEQYLEPRGLHVLLRAPRPSAALQIILTIAQEMTSKEAVCQAAQQHHALRCNPFRQHQFRSLPKTENALITGMQPFCRAPATPSPQEEIPLKHRGRKRRQWGPGNVL